MNKFVLFLAALLPSVAMAETVTLEGKDYEVTTVSDREIGPGIRHTRFRLPSYPLNINVLRVDLNNPYNTIETTVANESAKGTESLVKAAQRQSYTSHRALGGANANFWVVASQPENAVYSGTTRNASVRNGVIVTESNQHRDQWDGGTMRTGVVSFSSDRTVNIDYCTSFITATCDKFGTLPVHQSNKGVHDNELCMYNSYFGPSRQFQPIVINNGLYALAEEGDATEVILDFAEGQSWASNSDVTLTVKEVRLNKGKGTLGNHDLALVGRGNYAGELAKLAEGDQVTVRYGWIYNPGAENEVNPQVTQAVGGNALVMRNGELTEHNQNEAYNSQVYSRTGYGCSADGKMLYIVVIDKSNDMTHGNSAGCNTAKMCEFARWLGCYNMANFDAGGSAEMFIEDRIENTTTEGTPRAVANGWMVYSIAPEDADDYNTVTRLEFNDYSLQAPIYSSYTPKIIAYNRYGAVLDRDFQDYTLSCAPELGTCSGSTFTAAGAAASGALTATYGDVSVSKDMNVVEAQMSLRLHNILIDGTRSYPVEVTSTIGKTVYNYDPASLEWTIEDPEIISITDGVIQGLKEGTTGYTCRIGDFEDSGTATVEIASAETMGVEDWSTWKSKNSSGIEDVTLGAEGLLSFRYVAPRDPSCGVSGNFFAYSIPDDITLKFNSTIPVRSITVELRLGENTKSDKLTLKLPDDALYAAGETHTIVLPISEVADPADIAAYPVNIRSINFKVERDQAHKGNQSIALEGLYGTYSNFSGIDEAELPAVARVAVTPNPVNAGGDFSVRLNNITRVEVYTNSGVKISSTVAPAGADALTVAAPSVAGTYIVKAVHSAGALSGVLIVR